ncbi:uncharacterized protein [Spinacia oleracea]|uniref:Ubiquitin-like protease family profile domain-containing protein n=1 Tax=Spinacia oleracea TaxID=3562 RepID=A0ABM3RFF5_SPIOL|nr:uncharacterized protein LOC110779006 [Spinacia oleracea]
MIYHDSLKIYNLNSIYKSENSISTLERHNRTTTNMKIMDKKIENNVSCEEILRNIWVLVNETKKRLDDLESVIQSKSKINMGNANNIGSNDSCEEILRNIWIMVNDTHKILEDLESMIQSKSENNMDSANNFVNAYMLEKFDRQWRDPISMNRLYLPTHFHDLMLLGANPSSPIKYLKWNVSLVWYIPRGKRLDAIEKVYIPLFEQDHCFLVVIDLVSKVNYIVGSVAVNDQCEEKVFKLLKRCSVKYLKEEKMHRLFGDTLTYPFHIINLSLNSKVDSRVYLLTYLDVKDIKDCAHITLTGNEIQKQRVYFCTELFLSSLNE